MKVLFLSHSSVVPTYREKLRLLARRKEVELTLLLPKAWHEAGKRVETSDQPPEVEGFRILSAPVVFEGRIKRHFYPSFSHYARQIKPDIIHVEEEPYSLAAWQAARAARRWNARLVFFTWENLLEQFPFPHQQIREYVLGSAHHAIAGDQEAAQLLRKAGYPTAKISVIPQYGVDPELFRKKNVPRLKKQLGLGAFTVGYVGRLVPEKGTQDLLEAFAKAALRGSKLLLVGNGPLREELEVKARNLGIGNQTIFVQAMDQTRVPDYLNCMDALVLPSVTTPTWKEQFGRVLIEAQACEVPVIGSDSGAISEVIGKAGLVFKEGNVEALAGGLKKMSLSAAFRKRLAGLGRKQVLKLYTNRHIADKIFRIYQDILSDERT